MKQIPAHEILLRIFKVVVREAQNNPALAKELIEAIAANADKPRAAAGAQRLSALALTDVLRHCTIPAAAPQQADVTPKP